MRNALKVIIFLCAIAVISTATSQGSASALTAQDLSLTDDPLFTLSSLNKREKKAAKEQEKSSEDSNKKHDDEVIDEKVEVPTPTVHVVVAGESLSTIAKQYSTTWQRIFDKNTNIENPDVLAINTTLTIPNADEALTSRPLPQPVIKPEPTQPVEMQSRRRIQPVASRQSRQPRVASTAGNTYAAGYCTWYAKNRRPDLPNRMGNASSWVSSAAAHGYATGSAPRAGAIGQQGNHVVYVESVNPDGTVTVSEMNYKGLFIVSSRTVAASAFRYIY